MQQTIRYSSSVTKVPVIKTSTISAGLAMFPSRTLKSPPSALGSSSFQHTISDSTPKFLRALTQAYCRASASYEKVEQYTINVDSTSYTDVPQKYTKMGILLSRNDNHSIYFQESVRFIDNSTASNRFLKSAEYY